MLHSSHFPALHWIPYSSILSFASILCRMLLWYAVFSWYWTYGYCSTTGLRRLCREVVDQGHRPKDLFLVLVLLGRVNYPVPGFHLPVWVGFGLLLLHLEKNCKDPPPSLSPLPSPVSGFLLVVLCSEPVQGVPGVVYPAWPIFGLCFRVHLQTEQKATFSIWRRDGSRTFSGIPPLCSMLGRLPGSHWLFLRSCTLVLRCLSQPGRPDVFSWPRLRTSTQFSLGRRSGWSVSSSRIPWRMTLRRGSVLCLFEFVSLKRFSDVWSSLHHLVKRCEESPRSQHHLDDCAHFGKGVTIGAKRKLS